MTHPNGGIYNGILKKKDKVLIHATTRMNFKNILLIETKPITNVIIQFYTCNMSRTGRSIDRVDQWLRGVEQGEERQEWEERTRIIANG